MALSARGHGAGRGRPHIEVAKASDLPVGTAAAPEPVDRRPDGRIASADTARLLGKRGGLASARKRADAAAWGATLGLGRLLTLSADAHLAPFVEEGEKWLAAQCSAVARDVGGGELSPGVVSILRTAAWERLYSAWLFDAGTRMSFAWDVNEARKPVMLPRTELLAVAMRLGDASRQNLLAAHELAAREAKARPRAPGGLDMWTPPENASPGDDQDGEHGGDETDDANLLTSGDGPQEAGTT